jgi:hypothetical protein
MGFKKIPESSLLIVSGQWGVHKIEPRMFLNEAFGIVSTDVINNENIPQSVRDVIADCDDYDFNQDDFPAPEVFEEIE